MENATAIAATIAQIKDGAKKLDPEHPALRGCD
jgi:hypothetical protein